MSEKATSKSDYSRIVLIACYFGKLPVYAPLVFQSISANDTIDWILVTDQDPQFELPPNVALKKWTLGKLSDRFSNVLALPVVIQKPYQICNLRPAFGLVFSEYLQGYDFWGHVDLDVIYGDLRKFLPESVMESHDRIYARGHLSIYRNCPDVNGGFKLDTPGVVGYREVFSDPQVLPQFDEWPGIWKIFRYHQIRQYHAEVIADIKPPTEKWITRFEAEELENFPQQVFYWHNGKTFQAYYHREGGLFDREVAYVHFQKRSFPIPNFDATTAPGFLISPGGFTPYDRENLSPAEMETLNRKFHRPWKDIVSRFRDRAKKKINKELTKITNS